MRVPGAVALGTSIVLATGGCAAGMQQRPDGGTITVGVRTSGVAIAEITFRVAVEPDGITGSVKGDAGVFTRSNVPFGEHVVWLLDVPSRCGVDGAPERRVAISEQRRSAVVQFRVVCR